LKSAKGLQKSSSLINPLFLRSRIEKFGVSMNYETISAMQSLLQIGSFLLAVMLLIPKSVKSWILWKKTGKDAHLSGSVAMGVVAFFLLAGNFVTFMKVVLGC
jgi:hypothetical protein